MKRKKKKLKKGVIVFLGLLLLCGMVGCYFIVQTHNDIEEYNVEGLSIQHQFLTINPYSRSGKSLHKVNGLSLIHILITQFNNQFNST